MSAVQLGFSIEFEDDDHRMMVGHHSPLWRDWDGGQLGGRPTWLNPKDIPKHYLKCKCCDDPLVFVCQLYCPCDEINPDAFHRSFYVFACPNSSKKCTEKTTGTIRVLRTQLPLDNPYFPVEQDQCWAMHISESWNVNLCKVCGQRAHGKCPIQNEHFCGRHHQKEYKKYIFNRAAACSNESESFMPSLLHSSEMVVEEEPLEEKDEKFEEKQSLFENEDSDDELDGNLEQKDLNEMTGANPETVSKDVDTMKFYERINSIPNVNTQCLRYLRWPDKKLCIETTSPLWIRSDYKLDDEKIPSCERCGAERRFEFQLMPQMLHYLLKDHKLKGPKEKSKQSLNKKETEAVRAATNILEQSPPEQVPPDLVSTTKKAIEVARNKIMEGNANVPDWGSVSVFTCTASCGSIDTLQDDDLGAYIEEYTWKQPPLD